MEDRIALAIIAALVVAAPFIVIFGNERMEV
jgi:hypothetical protein